MKTLIKRLRPTLKQYDWGLPWESSLAARFGTPTAKPLNKCAEAWWGSHPSGPAFFTSSDQPLQNFPFLLKVISVGKALSIQLHPDRETAVELHRTAPQVYPDPSAKPEIVIAQTHFTALCGFLPPEDVDENIRQTFEDPTGIPRTFEELTRSDPQTVNHLVELASATNPLVKTLAESYPADPGALAPLYMSFCQLQPGEALVIPPRQPHCYLSGQGVECMLASDNVIRAGLTSKRCDLDLFFSLAQKDYQKPIVLSPVGERRYLHPCLDFQLQCLTSGSTVSNVTDGIILVMQGEGTLNGEVAVKAYDSLLLKGSCELHSDSGEILGYCASTLRHSHSYNQ